MALFVPPSQAVVTRAQAPWFDALHASVAVVWVYVFSRLQS